MSQVAENPVLLLFVAGLKNNHQRVGEIVMQTVKSVR